MPIPVGLLGRSDAASAILALFGQVHDQIRQEIEGLDDAGLNWCMGAETNSIATTVTHIVGSEAETLRCVSRVPCRRHRDDEFRQERRRRADVFRELEMADRLIAELQPGIGPPQLRRHLGLPTLPADERRSGLTWLVGNYGHAREHVGHIQVTKQLYVAREATP
jgi:hypothetical protein